MSSIKLLKAMIARPASKGWFLQFGGKKTSGSSMFNSMKHGARHRHAQMKFFSKSNRRSQTGYL